MGTTGNLIPDLIGERMIEGAGLGDIYKKVMGGERLSFDDGAQLYRSDDLSAVGYLANIVRERKNGNRAYYVRNQHLNYTNVCNKFCKFCSFYDVPKGENAYTLSPEEIQAKLLEHIDVPIREIHMVGGVNPKLPYEYYLDILRAIKQIRPDAYLKAFTMVELVQIERVAKKPLEETLLELKEAGMDAVPGGGAEVMTERVHEELFPLKIGADEWLGMARSVHQVGLKSNATILYGHMEYPEEKVEHLIKLRELQDETGGFLSYIPLSFHPENTELDYLPGPTGCMDLREVALARLMLDNFDHVKSFWIMTTPEVSQLSLWYGSDDIDGTIVEYEITRPEDGRKEQALTREQLIDMITEAGREPTERDPMYNVINEPVDSRQGTASPPLSPTPN